MTDIIKIAENRLDTLSDDLIIRGLINEVTTLREDLRAKDLVIKSLEAKLIADAPHATFVRVE